MEAHLRKYLSFEGLPQHEIYCGRPFLHYQKNMRVLLFRSAHAKIHNVCADEKTESCTAMKGTIPMMHEHEHEHEQLHEHCCDHTHEHESCDSGVAGCEHAHTHEHEHSHEHSHADGSVHAHAHSHSHTHGHTHGHSHDHAHGHAHGHSHSHGEVTGFDSLDQARALMAYMLDHNRHHADELHELCHKLEATGKDIAAELIHAAVDHFGKGNQLLESALEQLKQE